MSDSPLMSKMDALLKKHRGGGDEAPQCSCSRRIRLACRSHAAAQCLVARSNPGHRTRHPSTHCAGNGSPNRGRNNASAVRDRAPAPVASTPVSQPPEPDLPAPAAEPDSAVSDTLAEQLMSELAPRLSEVMEKQVAAELRKNLDQTVANLLSQLDVNVREIVRDAVTEKLKQPRDPST